MTVERWTGGEPLEYIQQSGSKEQVSPHLRRSGEQMTRDLPLKSLDDRPLGL